ncbi:carbonic anhydrase [Planktothrix sp. FACHB-1355]|uniref:Carbonic anhydrase n=1 Tax=Aerosakkonema funiforme FACHB-1375 TaxID=2949571 RepID=A0A926VFV2_9CYAN|nr:MULTISPECIES: carbonic anhydrase [Oscillatoriales]MBD2183124.1 carbonic anhydrase [Aerosakkonema funiforme FACHB-1375]MBD3559783.1 carbonic anhydrase [Planktothrix sp. FACHB-1355]
MNHSPNCLNCINRRHFLQLLPTALSVAVLSNAQPAKAANTAKALVLSCIDSRVLEAQRYFLSLQHLGNQYDLTALAGASLALSGIPQQADAEAFWDQLKLSYRLHHIQKVMIFDHQDCSAYADKIDPKLSEDSEKEEKVHEEYLSGAYWQIRDRYPDLNIELYFVTLNAEVKAISPLARV